jgi:hypothetical protein
MWAITKPEADAMGEFMREFWPYMKRFWKAEDNDEYFDELVDASNTLTDKYLDKQPEVFMTAKALVEAFMREQERKVHEQTAKEDGRQAG